MRLSVRACERARESAREQVMWVIKKYGNKIWSFDVH